MQAAAVAQQQPQGPRKVKSTKDGDFGSVNMSGLDGDEEYVALCRKIQRRIEWVGDIANEFRIGDENCISSSSWDPVGRMSVVHDVSTSTRNDLKRLQAHCNAVLDERERSLRLKMYTGLSDHLQRGLKQVETRAARLIGMDRVTTANDSDPGLRSYRGGRALPGGPRAASQDECRPLTPTQTCGVGGSAVIVRAGPSMSAPPVKKHLANLSTTGNFVQMDLMEEGDKQLQEKSALLAQLQRDIAGIQRLQDEFATHVKEGGDDLTAIEVNAKSTLLATKQATTQLAHAAEHERTRRRWIVWFWIWGVATVVVILLWSKV